MAQFAQVKRDRGLTLKTQEFTQFLKTLRTTLGAKTTMRRVVDYEVARVLERALEETQKADATKIRERVKNRSTFQIDGKNWRTRDYETGREWHVPDRIWAKMKDMRQRSLARKLAAVGISKRSWLILAERLGQEIKAPSYVKSARVGNSGFNGNARVEREIIGDKYGVRIINKMPILRFSPPAGVAAFFSALSGRIGFYRMNLAKGVFEDVKVTAQKYKGVLIGKR